MTRPACSHALGILAVFATCSLGCQATKSEVGPLPMTAEPARVVPVATPHRKAAVTEAATPSSQPVAQATQADDARGGLLYDRWYKAPDFKGPFEVGKAGGPDGTGVLKNVNGEQLGADGHGYRIKSYFGWDLRGAEGIYGKAYQAKPYVHATNLLTDTRSREELVAWFSQGDQQLPAFGGTMSAQDIEDLVDFIVKVRSGALPQPDQVWQLSKGTPKNYKLNEGGDAEAGKAIFAKSCKRCHGPTGDDFLIDEEHSVGDYGRTKGYEVWLKILNGHPGSKMDRTIEVGEDGAATAQIILNVLAALCDRQAFPAKSTANSIKDGDARCGAYLK